MQVKVLSTQQMLNRRLQSLSTRLPVYNEHLWVAASTSQSVHLTWAWVVPDNHSRFMLPVHSFCSTDTTTQQVGTLLVVLWVTRGQSQMDAGAGCCGELFSTPSVRGPGVHLADGSTSR